MRLQQALKWPSQWLVSVWYIKRGQRPPELGDPYFGCGEQDLIPRTVTSVLVWRAGKEMISFVGLKKSRRGDMDWENKQSI